MNTPLVSTIMPLYNGEKYLLKSLETVFRQNYPRNEIIIVNDGSTDNSLELLKPYQDKLKIISHENKGPSSARNTGIRESKGEILAFLDADDFWTEQRLPKMVNMMMEDPKIDMVRGKMQTVSLDGDRMIFNSDKTINRGEPGFLPFLIGACIYRKNVFEKVGHFDTDLRFGEDVDWLMKAEEKNINVRPMDEITLLYHRHMGNMTRVNAPFDLGLLKVIRNKIQRNKDNNA